MPGLDCISELAIKANKAEAEIIRRCNSLLLNHKIKKDAGSDLPARN